MNNITKNFFNMQILLLNTNVKYDKIDINAYKPV